MGEFVLLRRSQRLRRHRSGQHRQRVGVEHVIAIPLQHRHEHPVAAVGALHQHRRDDRHHHAEKALAADTFGDLGEADRRLRPQRLVVSPQQFVVMLPTILRPQRAAEEVRQVRECRPPGNGLPIDHGQRAVGPGGPEQHVVQPVVTVHQALHPALRRHPLLFRRQIAVERGDQAFAHDAVLRRDLVAVPVDETGVQRRDHRLIERSLAVEPRRLGQRGVPQQRAVQPSQLDDAEAGLFGCGAGDFVADDRGPGVAEQQIEHARRGVDGGVVTGRYRPAQARRDVAVEADLTLVETQSRARSAGSPDRWRRPSAPPIPAPRHRSRRR